MSGGASLALLTDLYQVTMAHGYWKLGRADDEAVFHLFFRRAPFAGGYAVAAGLGPVIEFLRGLRFTADDLAYLAGLTGNDGRALFEAGFLEYLAGLRFTCEVDGVPEGTAVFAHEPLLRRAQGVDGALTAARAAFIGGCAATSNVLAGKLYGIPVKGTHAHSWVMSFADEHEAFAAYARAMPNNCVFLVDTYDTLEGVRRAIAVGRTLRELGHALGGVRLDSGDLGALSVAARELLDAAGFHDAAIVASNDLDERTIAGLRAAGARISVWGVGTKLVTAYDQPALGGVYKLAAIRRTAEDPWDYRIKLSEEPIKVSNPGIQQVRRLRAADGQFVGDVIFEATLGVSGTARRIDTDEGFACGAGEDLLVPVMRGGEVVYVAPTLAEARARARAQVAALPEAVRRLDGAEAYPVGLDERLLALKMKVMAAARGQ